MGKRRPVTDAEMLQALGHAATRAIYWAHESLLVDFSAGNRTHACRRLALGVLTQLAGDGWGEGEVRVDGADLFTLIAAGIGRAGEPFLRVLPEIKHGHERVLDAMGAHIGAIILSAMHDAGVYLRRRRWSPSRPPAPMPKDMRDKFGMKRDPARRAPPPPSARRRQPRTSAAKASAPRAKTVGPVLTAPGAA